MRAALLEKVNPFVKAATILLCGLLLACFGSVFVNLATAVLCFGGLVLFSRCRFGSLLRLLAPALLLAAALFCTGLFFGAETASHRAFTAESLSAAALLASRILGYVGLGGLFALSTDSQAFVTALMLQGHIKPKFAYGILAAFHLLPAISRELSQAQLACQVRGMRLAPWKPLFNALVNCIRWSETMAMAMESKGFDGNESRTCRTPTTLGRGDVLFAGLCLLAMAGAVLCARLMPCF